MESELKIMFGDCCQKYKSSLSYELNHIMLRFKANNTPEIISGLISENYMHGALLEDFSIQMNTKCLSVDLSNSSIDKVWYSDRIYELQLNQIEYVCDNDAMNNGILINLPPIEIGGLTKNSKQKTIQSFGSEITFVFVDDRTTRLICPKELQKVVVSLLSLYYCFSLEILQEPRQDYDENHSFMLRSQKHSFEKVGSLINLYAPASNVIEFLKLANSSHPYFQELPRYARQFIDSYNVSEPQRYSMLFAMITSFAEYVLKKGKHGGEDLVKFSINHFNLSSQMESVETTIKEAKLSRIIDEKETEIDDLAKLRNESEHCLYSDSSYVFFDAHPAVNVFMNEIACRIVLELAGIKS